MAHFPQAELRWGQLTAEHLVSQVYSMMSSSWKHCLKPLKPFFVTDKKANKFFSSLYIIAGKAGKAASDERRKKLLAQKNCYMD